MTVCVVDASVVAKWLVAEELSDEAASLLQWESTLVAPELVFAEVTNALWAMCRRGDIGAAEFDDAVDVPRTAPVAVPQVRCAVLLPPPHGWRLISTIRCLTASNLRWQCWSSIAW